MRTYEVEEHTGGRAGIGAGPATGTYTTREAAVRAMGEAHARGHGATCVVRDARGRGRICRLEGSMLISYARVARMTRD